MARRWKIIIWATLSTLLLTGGGGLWVFLQVHAPFRSASSPLIIEFPKGASVRSIAATLEQDGLIRSRHLFSLLAWGKGQSRNLRAGEYRLSASMAPSAILAILVRGEVVQHPVTIPEGYTLREIASVMEQAGLVPREEVLNYARNPSVLREFRIPAASAEGYLFPETYRFPKGVSPQNVVRRLLITFRNRFTPQMRELAEERGLTVHQVVTLASIIEREAAIPRERPLISAVFQNRMRRGMRLQADPTVRYALEKFFRPLTKEDLKVDSPYNTYRVQGLPPGPIANPGLDSIRAVLHPAPVDYLYFVAQGDGSHRFSRTLRQHNQAVREFRRTPGGVPENRVR